MEGFSIWENLEYKHFNGVITPSPLKTIFRIIRKFLILDCRHLGMPVACCQNNRKCRHHWCPPFTGSCRTVNDVYRKQKFISSGRSKHSIWIVMLLSDRVLASPTNEALCSVSSTGCREGKTWGQTRATHCSCKSQHVLTSAWYLLMIILVCPVFNFFKDYFMCMSVCLHVCLSTICLLDMSGAQKSALGS